jgi:hypothetical protein
MTSVQRFGTVALLVGLAACDQDPTTTRTPAAPPPVAQGVQAFIQVDNDHAKPGDQVQVFVRVQLGTESQAKVGSYTGLLTFDTASLGYRSETKINDGLRVTNPAFGVGKIKFAGVAATGLADLTLYAGTFDVKRTDYRDRLALDMEELSAAMSLGNLRPQLQLTPQVFLRSTAR